MTGLMGVNPEHSWQRWIWTVEPQVLGNFRRMNGVPEKTQQLVCQCPPNNVCKADYHINDKAAELLKLRGVYDEKDVENYKEEAKKEQQANGMSKDKQKNQEYAHQLQRRSMRKRESANTPCCCPLADVRMISFITQQKFEYELERIKKQGESMKKSKGTT